MTRPMSACRSICISCSLCDFVAESSWIDDAVRALRDHAKAIHDLQITHREAAALVRNAAERQSAA